MKLIEKLSDHIREEIEDACKYIDDAMACKENDRDTADLYCRLNDISNYQQSQYILGQTGRWVAWVGSGSQTAPTGT